MTDELNRSTLTETDKKRYNRNMMISGWGEAGQEKVKSARIFIAGAGGLGIAARRGVPGLVNSKGLRPRSG